MHAGDPPTIEVRPFRDGDRQAVRRLRYRTFSADEFEPDEDERYIDDDRRVVAVLDGRVVGHAGAWRFGQFFGGRCVPMAGVAAVTVEPHARGRGAASAMVRRLLALVAEHGDAISSLYPATVAPYRRLGWEIGGSRPVYTLPTRALLDVPAPRDPVELRPGTAEDAARMRSLYLGLASRHDGWLALDPRYLAYNAGELHDRGADEWWVAERGGEVVGYTLYSRAGGQPEVGNRLIVRELVAADISAERSLWRLVGGSWTVWPRTQLRTAVHPDLLHELPEDGVVEVGDVGPARWTRWMTRIVDLPAAVSARGYPGAADVEVHLEVADPVLPGNDGRFVLRVVDGQGSAEPGGQGSVRVDVGALSAIFTGATPASTWEHLGRLRADDRADVARLDGVVRGPTPTTAHYF